MTDLVTHLKTWGLDVETQGGYTRNGRPGSFTPRGVLCHHTASNRNSGNFGSLNTVLYGRPDLPGPLCQLLLGRDGTVRVISIGRTNHAGYGGPRAGVPKDQGNQYLWGIEAENDGLGEPWSKAQYQAYVRLCAALLAFMKTKDTQNVFAHKEWAPGRKSDPAGINMAIFRNDVAETLKKGAPKNLVSLSNLQPKKFHPQVVKVKRRLKKRGYFKSKVLTPFFGNNLKKAYAEYQKDLGYSGPDASGVPGKISLQKLGFIVL